MRVELPEPLGFLLDRGRWRYKIVYGGRGGVKSWSFARAALLLGAGAPLRILCARETQKSIADSVHALLRDQIAQLGLARFYNVRKASVEGANGTSVIFAGLRHNINNIKSVEACDIVWVEEAQSVSKNSWDVLVPTIRKAGSEIWASFNPKLETDETYRRFVLQQRPDARVVKTTWRDNPWLPEPLRIEKDHLAATDPRAYRHVWEGECESAVEGAIYAEEIARAERENRITQVSYDRLRPVDTYWDLGFGDLTAIWFVQTLENGDRRLIDYLENRGKPIEWYVIQMQQRQYMYGQDWLPHDGVDAIIHSKLGGGDRSRSIEMQLRHAGRRVRIAPKLTVASGINAARSIFPRCWFDAEKCADGLQALRHYQWGDPPLAEGPTVMRAWGEMTAEPGRREPLHNWASHGADAFRTFAVASKAPQRYELDEERPRRQTVLSPWS